MTAVALSALTGLLVAACGPAVSTSDADVAEAGGSNGSETTGDVPSVSGSPIAIPTGKLEPGDPSASAMAALLEGTFQITPDGCTVLVHVGEQVPVVWPHGYSGRLSPEGVAAIIDERGRLVALSGDQLSLGGGFGKAVFDLPGCERYGEAWEFQGALRPRGVSTQPSGEPSSG